MRVSIAVPAYNEERNIGELLDTLRAQRVKRAKIVEVVVVASGCTDRTAEIVRERMARPGVPVRLIEEPERRGKVAAINSYLRALNPHVDAICVCSADLLVSREVVERLVQCFLINPEVGMCGGRPMPTNGKGSFTGEATRFLWQMHHRVALEAPKLGELVMIRAGIVRNLPPESAVDEASIEQLVCNAGYRLAYVPEAVVHNHGPETVRDFIRQRRRIAAGHIWLRSVSGYSVSTMNVWRIARLALSELDITRPREALFRLGTMGVEAISRVLGFVDYHTNSTKHAVWKVSETTKRVMNDQVRELYLRDSEEEAAGSGVDRVPAQQGRATGT
ncbi:MAG: glycosyltransferase [Myxococcales bacterium]|jgi:biofilm PGA synthesis N-glycosyltransferase PgaC|nr:glycosyltransferase [Myxococcales bacterium]